MVEAFGDGALRFSLPPGVDRAGLGDALRAIAGVSDVVFAEEIGAVYVDDPEARIAEVREVLASPRTAAAALDRPCVVIEAVYDGPDLARVAEWAGVSPGEVVRRHAERTYTVIYLGFLPGFAYLGEVDPVIAAPRLAAPRPRVPAGSLAIAGGRTGVYPSASPGGWNLIGRVEAPMFDLERGARLRAGDRVIFRERR